jgi:hypothetical protein
MKSFYSCIDAGGLVVPQPIQHLAIRDKAQKAGGAVTFYGSEEAKTLKSQAFIRAKLRRSKGLDGVIFFSLHQFRYGPDFNFKLLKEILGLGLEVHFAREGLSILNAGQLDELFPFLTSVDYTARRDRDPSWVDFLARSASY